MSVHFVASGGSVLPNLSIALFYKGCQVNDPDNEGLIPFVSREKKFGARKTFDEVFFRRNADGV